MIFSPNVINDGLIFCTDAANKRSYVGSGTTVNNLMGNDSSTLVNGTAFSTNKNGVFTFDGTNDYILAQTSTFGSQSFSISMWFNATETTNNVNGYDMLFGGDGYGNASLNGLGHYIRYSTDITTWVHIGSTYTQISNITNVLHTGSYHNLVLQRDYGTAWTWYLDGVYKGNNTSQDVS